MNKARRKELTDIKELVDELHDRLKAVANEEQEAYDNLSEGLQGSDRGQAMEDAASQLTDAYGLLSEVSQTIDEVMQ